MYCTRCGSEAQEGALFCARCGARHAATAALPGPLPGDELPSVPPPPPAAPAAQATTPAERKSPAAALLLNLLVPGLGTAYAGDRKQGFWQFVSVVGVYLFAWKALAVFMYLFFAVVALVLAQKANDRVGA